MSDLQLAVNGSLYGGWKSVRIARGLEQCAGGFDIGVSELWPAQSIPREISPGDECVVQIDGEPVITGYVDVVQLGHDGDHHDVAVAGRDKTADLVDCSAIKRSGQWSGRKLEQIAADLCEPFGITVTSEVDTGKAFPNFALQEGETVFEAVERMARIRALLVVNDGRGGLVITRPSTQRVATRLVLGENILQAQGALDWRDRFGTYVMKGQAAGGDFFSGKAASQIRAEATDPAITRYRPMVVVSEGQDVAASLKQRVQWEATVRAARSVQVSITVNGWRHSEGVWAPNRLVTVVDPWLRLNHDLLIKHVLLTLDEGGELAQLQLTRPDAYSLLPLKQPEAGGAGFKWDMPGKKAGG